MVTFTFILIYFCAAKVAKAPGVANILRTFAFNPRTPPISLDGLISTDLLAIAWDFMGTPEIKFIKNQGVYLIFDTFIAVEISFCS